MIRYLAILFLLISPIAQSQTVQWAIKAGGASSASFGSYDDIVTDITVDPHGDVYICGNFYGTSSNINNIPIVNNGSQDSYIAKLDCNGNVLWVRSVGGTQEDISAESIKLDLHGNVYLTGWLRATPANKWMFFDTLIGDSTLLESWFLAKFDTSGNFLWGQMAQNDFHNGSKGYDIEIDNSGKPVVSIYTVDGEILPGLNLDTGFYLVTLDTSGSLSNVMRPNPGHSSIDLKHFKFDNLGNVYVSGSWKGDSVDIDGDIYYNPHPSFASQENFLLYSCDSVGNTRWYHVFTDTVPNPTINAGRSIIMDSSNNIYISGDACKNLVSDNYVFSVPTGWNVETQLVAKFDSNGNQQWIRNFPFQYAGRPFASDIALRPNGNLVTAYVYQGKSLVGPDTIYPSANSLNDIVLTELTTSGNIVSHEELHGMNEDFITSIACTSTDVVYAGGAFKSQLNVNSQIITNAGGKTDGFVAQFGGTCTTSLIEIHKEIELKTYPNPVSGLLTVSWNNKFKPRNYKIYGSVGELLIEEKITSMSLEIKFNTASLCSGIYLFQVLDSNGRSSTAKFIKE